MMGGLVLTLSLLFSSANMAASLTVTATTESVTVRKGERLQLSCVIETGPGETVSEVKWYRGMDVNAYASLSIPLNCALFPDYFCAEGRTVDDRGRVIYQKNTTAVATLTLIFASGNLTNSTIFSCGAVLADGSQEPKRSKSIPVTVCNFPSEKYPVCTYSWPFSQESMFPALICEAKMTDPVVSLEWTTVVNSSRISLSNNTVIAGDEVKNTLDLTTVDSSYYSLPFTCYMRSEACPGIEKNCSLVLVKSANPASTLPDETVASVSGHLDQSVSTSPSNITECCNDDPGTSSPSPTPTSTKHPVSSNVNIVLIAAIAGASSFALLILIVAVCLFSRRKARRRRNGAASRDINFHVYANTVPGTKTSRCPANVYDEDHRGDREGMSDTVPTGDNRLTGPVQPPAAYASVPVVGLQDPQAPVYDVLDPDMASSRETSGDF